MSVVALVPDDGCGEGVGRGQSAALLPVAGVPLVVHLVRRLFAAGCVDRALISVAADDLTAVSGALDQHGAGPPGACTVPGDPLARRLDTPFDLLAAEASLSVAGGAG